VQITGSKSEEEILKLIKMHASPYINRDIVRH